jgi:hypothetical protein
VANGKMISEWFDGRDVEGISHGLILGTIPASFRWTEENLEDPWPG